MVKITGIEPLGVTIQFKTSRRPWLIFKLLTDEPGLFGIGESSLNSYDAQVLSIMQEWVQHYLSGKDPMHHELHWTRLYQDTWARGGALGTTALSGIDIALWDLKGKILNRPVYELLGGPLKPNVRVYANGWYSGSGTPPQMAEWARIVVEKGFDAMKFDPFGTNNYYTISPQEAQLAEDRVAAVREAVGPHVEILV